MFVLIGPLYGLKDLPGSHAKALEESALAFAAFAFASSACYIVNDLTDAELDRTHPRKRHRPIASGAVTPSQAGIFGMLLAVAATAMVMLLQVEVRLAVGIIVAAYVLNVLLYSYKLKNLVIADVMSLSLGFVLRMFGGCAAVGIGPTTWLLNCTLFLAMYLAFGKRLGERRTMGEDAASARVVQGVYTDNLLRMAVVVTAVANLITYAGYVQAHDAEYTHIVYPFMGGVNFLWFTMVPATYALLRSIVLLEQGRYDDPTELAAKDLPMQLAVGLFGALSLLVLSWKLWLPG